MTKIDLLGILSATLSKKRVAELVLLEKSKGFAIQELYNYCFHFEPTVAFRASWVLETITLNVPERLNPVLHLFLADFPKQSNRSCQRHFTRILMTVQDKKAPLSYQLALKAADREALVTTVFEWVIDPETPVAVLANCIDVLYAFSGEFEWISEELGYQLVILMDRGSPALNSRGKRVLQRLNKKR